MRCFIAVDLKPELRCKISELQEAIRQLGINVKFVGPDNLHYTINFLGDLNENEVDTIKVALERIKCEKEFPIKIGCLGYFGREDNIRTLWVGVKEGEDELIKLMKSVNKNINMGEKSFTPHLTIGRVKTSKNQAFLLKFIEKNKDVNVGEMYVKEVKLKLSELRSDGPVYSDLFIVALGLK
jgi:2'-5' RNA ligase